MLILDTNVLSELMRPRPARAVLDWINGQRPQEIYTTAISEAEILVGIALLPTGKRRDTLHSTASRAFERYRPGRILTFDSSAAAAFAQIVATRRAAGRPIATVDAQIAAIVASRRAILATRDVADFASCGFTIIDPWSP